MTITTTDAATGHPLPFYLSGRFSPVADEIDARNLPVEGAIPPELDGRYLRNGPNPLPGTDPGHWFVGHGMLHGVRLRAGRAEWYRNRWIRTGALDGRPRIDANGRPDLSATVANTHIVEHAGHLLALVENGLPYEVTAELETLGPRDFGGRLTTAMSAHPATDPVTAEMYFFGYSTVPPYLTYHKVSAAGELVMSRQIDVPGPTMMHTFAITEHYAVFLDLPLVFDRSLLGRGLPFTWSDDYGARIGIMARDDPGASVRWFDIDPCYAFHVGNAHEDQAGRVILDAARYAAPDAARMWAAGVGEDDFTFHHGDTRALGTDPVARATYRRRARMHRWVLDPRSGHASEAELDDRNIEFPTIDDTYQGRPSQYRYLVSDSGPAHDLGGAIVKIDLSGTSTAHELGPDVVAGETVFVPSGEPDRAEDDGWLLSITTRRDGSASRLLVLDATDVVGPPVASIILPRAVPAGFHGSWIPERS